MLRKASGSATAGADLLRSIRQRKEQQLDVAEERDDELDEIQVCLIFYKINI